MPRAIQLRACSGCEAKDLKEKTPSHDGVFFF
jgi:hypothetical protein